MLTDSGMGKCPLSCGAAPCGTASRARLAAGSGAVPAACNSAVCEMAPDELMAWLLGVGSGSPSRTARPCCPHPQPGVSAGSRGLARTVMEWVAPGPARSPGIWAAPGKGPPGRMTPTSPTYQGSGWDGAEAAGRGIPLTPKKRERAPLQAAAGHRHPGFVVGSPGEGPGWQRGAASQRAPQRPLWALLRRFITINELVAC